jgi:hypothetical protein
MGPVNDLWDTLPNSKGHGGEPWPSMVRTSNFVGPAEAYLASLLEQGSGGHPAQCSCRLGHESKDHFDGLNHVPKESERTNEQPPVVWDSQNTHSFPNVG